jgi:hypothetical protein
MLLFKHSFLCSYVPLGEKEKKGRVKSMTESEFFLKEKWRNVQRYYKRMWNSWKAWGR